MTNLRFEAVAEASRKKPLEVATPAERPSEFFGKKVFNRQKMYKYLPADIYAKLVDVIDNGARLDRAKRAEARSACGAWAPWCGRPCRSTRPVAPWDTSS